MSNKKKIVIVISIISVMILYFSISSFAVVYPNGMELHDGDIIIFNDILSGDFNGIQNISFELSGGSYYNCMFTDTNSGYLYYGKYKSSNTNSTAVYTNNGNYWLNHVPPFKTIIINTDQTITDEAFINWLYENTVSGLPDPPTPPHLEPTFWETVSGFFSEALAYGTAIVNWMTITPIALIPLALYCLIVIIAITKRMIKG